MSGRSYDVVFVGGGLAAVLLLRELTPLPGRVAVIEPEPPLEKPPVHWSYWSRYPTSYDSLCLGAWRRARVADAPPESIAPFTLRLVRSTDFFQSAAGFLDSLPIDWLREEAISVSRRKDETYEVVTDAGAVSARRVFDSAAGVSPAFPDPDRPRAVLSGPGLRIRADRPVFDEESATLLDPLDERSFAYLLPLSPVEALLESASFGATAIAGNEDQKPLLRYLRTRHPGAGFSVIHAERGTIPLGFAPPRTAGPRHVLLGAKRGLVKPSAGYGIVRIAAESAHLGSLWRQGRRLPPRRKDDSRWRLLDEYFLRLATRDPRRPVTLLEHVMRNAPISRSLRFIDEDLSARELAPLMLAALPAVLRGPERSL